MTENTFIALNGIDLSRILRVTSLSRDLPEGFPAQLSDPSGNLSAQYMKLGITVDFRCDHITMKNHLEPCFAGQNTILYYPNGIGPKKDRFDGYCTVLVDSIALSSGISHKDEGICTGKFALTLVNARDDLQVGNIEAYQTIHKHQNKREVWESELEGKINEAKLGMLKDLLARRKTRKAIREMIEDLTPEADDDEYYD